MSKKIELPKQKLEDLIEEYNKTKASLELEIVYGGKINEKGLKKINSYFKKISPNKENEQIILSVNLEHFDKNKRLSILDTSLEDYCNFERDDNAALPKKNYILEQKTFKNNVNLENIDSKINLKEEIEVTDSIEQKKFLMMYKKTKKSYRYKKRNSYQFDDYRIDITIVKFGKGTNIILTDLDQEKIELEIEYTSKKDLTMEVLNKMIKNITVCNQIIKEGYFNISNNESKIIKKNYMEILKKYDIKYPNIGPKPVSLTKNTIIKMLEQTGSNLVEGKENKIEDIYKITEKADGERYYLYIDKESTLYLINSNSNVIKTGIKLKSGDFAESILDGELIIIDKKYVYKYFDIYIKNNEKIFSNTLDKRIELMKQLTEEINNKSVSYIQEDKNIECSMKEYNGIDQFNTISKLDEYKIDGVIYMYNNGLTNIKNIKDISILKYKPLKQNTIDVLLLDKKLYCSKMPRYNKNNIYENNVGIKCEIMCTKPYIVDLHKKKVFKNGKEIDYELLNNKIIEIVYKPEEEYFELEKIRYDKTQQYIKTKNIAGQANDFIVVNDIIGHSCNPITDDFLNDLTLEKLKDLQKYVTRKYSYYENENEDDNEKKSKKSKNDTPEGKLRTTNNKIKLKLINDSIKILNSHKNDNIKVLEIACGQGGEINKYISTNFDNRINSDNLNDNGIKFILGIDIDTKNIEYVDPSKDGKNNRARARFISGKNEYIKNISDNISENISEYIPYIYRENTGYFMTGDINNYTMGDDVEKSYNEIMSNLKHKFDGKMEEDNNMDFEKRKEYDLQMLKDINTNKKIDLFEKEQFELISCQFAIHYLDLDKFCKYIDLQLKPAGIFICTFMEKQKIIKLLDGKEEISGNFWGLRKNKNNPEEEIDVRFKTAGDIWMTEKYMTLDNLTEKLSKYNIILYENEQEKDASGKSSINNTIDFGDYVKNNDPEFEFNKLYTGVIFQKKILNKKFKQQQVSQVIKTSKKN